jgi:outer membrane lipoprotein-sorting protein
MSGKLRIQRRHVLMGAGAFALVPARLRAASPTAAAAPLDAAAQGDVLRVQEYLNGITTMQSRFQQYAADGGGASGMIYLERPGKMRIDYDDPTPILIVADGRGVYYWDKKLKQLSQAPVEDTPAWFLLRPQIRLTGDVTVTRFERSADTFRITVTETKRPDQGRLTLVMSDKPLALRQWTVIDAQQKPITVALDDPHFGVTLSQNLFYWSSRTDSPY